MKIKLGIILFAMSFLGCIMAPPPEGGIKKIYLKPFGNQTVEYSLHTELFKLVQSEFLRDSYIELVSEDQAEYKVSGVISGYDLRPISYSMQNYVESFEMIIKVKLTLDDLLESEVVFQETFETNEIYFTKEGNPNETLSNTQLEAETQEDAIDLLARDITRKIVYAK
ncbi:MAG: hypothetical protein GY817_08730 [bacterium]|nr:hypothetical protein [bacterium]